MPVCWDEKRRIWVLTCYRDIIAAFKDVRFSSAAQETALRLQSLASKNRNSIAEISATLTNQVELCDPPLHTRLRTLLRKAIARLDLNEIQNLVQTVVDELLDVVLERGEADLVQDLASPLPRRVIHQVLGIEPSQREYFERHTSALLDLFGNSECTSEDLEKCRESAIALSAMVGNVSKGGPREARDGLIRHLVSITDKGDCLKMDEIVANVILFFAAGHGTTANLITNGVLALLNNADQMERLQSRPWLIDNAIEEMLRFDSPIQSVGRATLCDIDMAGRTIPRGDTMMLILGSANRDEQQFTDPHKFDICRHRNNHVAFGYGTHYCLGAALARLQARIAIGTLLRRTRKLELAVDSLSWHAGPTFRGLKTLPIRCMPS